MGKKGKRNSRTSALGRLEGIPHSMRISVDGRLPPRECGRLYSILEFLAHLELPRLEKRRLEGLNDSRPLGWKPRFEQNSLLQRRIMIASIMIDIDFLAQEVESGKHDELFYQLYQTNISDLDKREIASWRMHIEDDFFVVRHRPKEGSVFVQVGPLTEQLRGGKNVEVHEPRVFVVQGHFESFRDLARNHVTSFENRHKSILNNLNETEICIIHTALIPFNGGITFSGLIGPPVARYYETAMEMKNATTLAVNAAKQALSADGSSVPFYRTLKLRDHARIRLSASEHESMQVRMPELSFSETNGITQEQQQALQGTEMAIHQEFWNATEDVNSPRNKITIDVILSGKRPYPVKGFLTAGNTKVVATDDEDCPFHRHLGKEVLSFRDCCKSSHLKRRQKAEDKVNSGWTNIVYEPPDAESYVKLKNSPSQSRDSLIPFLRIGYVEGGTVKFTVPTEVVQKLKERIDMRPCFHATSQYHWLYLSSVPLRLSVLGVLCYAEMELIPSTGILIGTTKTPRRLSYLIREMKLFLKDLPVLSATLESQPFHKIKPNMEALAENEALLREGLEDVNVTVSIDKKANENNRVCCAYCHETEQTIGAPLSRCACKTAYYCCKDHQDAHWEDHKKICLEVRRKSK